MGLEFNLSLKILKEPRGFIKLLEFVFAIFAFSTCGTFSNDSACITSCSSDADLVTETNDTTTPAPRMQEYVFTIEYPFDLSEIRLPTQKCGDSRYGRKPVTDADYTSQAQFFVMVGVAAFLYCIAISLIYFVFDHHYVDSACLIYMDFGLTTFLSLFWFIGSSALAQALTGIKEHTSSQYLVGALNKTPFNWQCATNADPRSVDGQTFCVCVPPTSVYGNLVVSYGSLTASVLFGFLNWILWTGNLWFVYKETPFFRRRRHRQELPNGNAPAAASPSPPSNSMRF